MNHEISFPVLLKTFKKCWWKVAIIAICAMLIMAAFTIFFIPKKYSSSMEVYIINSNTSYDYTTSSLLAANTYLINDYIAIIQGDEMLNRVCNELKAEAPTYKDSEGQQLLSEEQIDALNALQPRQIRSMIKSSASAESSIFKLSISHTDPDLAYVIAYKIAKLAPEEVTKVAKSDINDRNSMAQIIHGVMNDLNKTHENENKVELSDVLGYLEEEKIGLNRQDCIDIIINPKFPTSHDSPNVPVYTILSGIAAAVIAYVVFLLLTLSKSVIITEEDVRKHLNYPLIGIIPHWSMSGNKSSKN